ncbi:hypothetical protein [Winogradskyella ursingii]|uniref:hypothetical protein n=1 Tax=Winogradskyella ursingii TaxID=2686079 RepID=UPI0015C90A56|nr:hypothetical protein [Winogradskyella ursingii]
MSLSASKNNIDIFKCFSIFWCISTLVHQLIWSEWFTDSVPLAWLITLCCLTYLITATKYIVLFVIAVILSALWYFSRQPLIVNHLFYETIISILMASVIIVHLVKKQLLKSSISLSNYFAENAIPLLRTSLIILYFFAVLHKLNYSYFNTDISCGAVLFENMLHNLKLMNIGFIEDFYSNNQIALANFSIYFSLIAELVIPILLLIKRTRTIGVLVGMIFHFVLALEGLGAIVSFTAMMFTYLMLFSSDRLISRAIVVLKSYRKYVIVGFILSVIAIIISSLFFSDRIFNMTVGLIWIIYSVIVIAFYLWNIKLNYNKIELKLSSKHLVYWMFPILVFLNGFSPYLGLKTTTSFSMFSNLVTENGKNNHFFIPDDLQLFDYQKQVVIIKSTNIDNLQPKDEWNKAEPYNYLLFEFVRRINKTKSGYVNFEVNGESYYVEKNQGNVVKSNIDLNQNSFMLKVLMFRSLYTNNISYCRQ